MIPFVASSSSISVPPCLRVKSGSVVHAVDEPLLAGEVEVQTVDGAVAQLRVVVVAVDGIGVPPLALQAPGAGEGDDAARAAVGAGFVRLIGDETHEVGLVATIEDLQRSGGAKSA